MRNRYGLRRQRVRRLAQERVRKAACSAVFGAQELLCKTALPVQRRVDSPEDRVLMERDSVHGSNSEGCLPRPVTESELTLGPVPARGGNAHHVHCEFLLRSEELLPLARVAEESQHIPDCECHHRLEQGPQENQTGVVCERLHEGDPE